MSVRVRKLRELTLEIISKLQDNLQDYYRHPPENYYQISDQAATQYSPSVQPFHCDLVKRVTKGMSILELGCGSAHLCPFIEGRGGIYTGIDHSETLLRDNRRRFSKARFFPVTAMLREQFDIVASLYTIEHVVNPIAYLERMWSLCKPEGLITIICPDFIRSPDYPPSFYYGNRPTRFRDKVKSLHLFDALGHLVDLFLQAARWKKRALKAGQGAFWINLRPTALAKSASYSIDADAVYLPSLDDLVWWFTQRGAEILTTSHTLPNVDPLILRYNCYIVARKNT